MLMQRKSDGHWTQCQQGHVHWGRNGAAGMLLRHVDDSGQERYLLQQRGEGVQNPGTWSTPGGAIEDGETPHAAAMREATEELGQFPAYNLQHKHTLDHGGWAYHTMTADVPHPFYPHGEGWDPYETQDAGWFTPSEIDELPLHPGFREGWDQYKPNQRPDPHREIWSRADMGARVAEQRGWTDFYHVSPRANRESIQNLGLMGENGSSPWSDPWQRNQPHGNYFFDNPQDAENYAWNLKQRTETPEDWEDRYEYPEQPEDYPDWDFDKQDEWDEQNPPTERIEDPNGYDIWRVNTRNLPIHRDPESAINQDEPPTNQQLGEHFQEMPVYDREGDPWQQQLMEHANEYGQTPRRFYTPEQVEPARLQLHQHLPSWNMTEEQSYDRMDDPETTEQEVPVAWDEMQLRRPQFPAHSHTASYKHAADTLWYHPSELQKMAEFVPELPEQDGSTEPQEVANPEDHWPDWGERPPDWPSGTHTDYDWALTRV